MHDASARLQEGEATPALTLLFVTSANAAYTCRQVGKPDFKTLAKIRDDVATSDGASGIVAEMPTYRDISSTLLFDTSCYYMLISRAYAFARKIPDISAGHAAPRRCQRSSRSRLQRAHGVYAIIYFHYMSLPN